jgi:hypothetical protein
MSLRQRRTIRKLNTETNVVKWAHKIEVEMTENMEEKETNCHSFSNSRMTTAAIPSLDPEFLR